MLDVSTTILWIIIIIYLLPWIIGTVRRHKNINAIGMLNLLVGWTVIGWVWVFIWAWTCNVKEKKKYGRRRT